MKVIPALHDNEIGLLSVLQEMPVLGVSMAGIAILRLDQWHALAPGNKWFKLQGNLARARQLGARRLVSFGGAWSNHLHALAALGYEAGYDTVGILRGEATARDSAMLADARAWGMEIVNVTRAEYRLRDDPAYIARLEERFRPCLVIPEGGANAAGTAGCTAIAGMVKQALPGGGRVVLPVGTGTTLAGLIAGLDARWEVVGISCLKGAHDLEARVASALQDCGMEAGASWRILHDFHCGGFARTNTGLRDFILAFEQVHRLPLEPVYTGKMIYAMHQLLSAGEWDSRVPLLAIHTGGLQGRRGFSWLDQVGL